MRTASDRLIRVRIVGNQTKCYDTKVPAGPFLLFECRTMKEKLFFKNSKGNKLCGILSNPTSSKEKPIIILCHGFSTNKDANTYMRLEKTLNDKEISTFRFDFYGHGESEGKFEDITISEAVDDVLNAIKFIRDLGYKMTGLFGSSFGGMASIIAASKTNGLFVLALKSPVSDYLGKIIAEERKVRINEWKKRGVIEFTSRSSGAKRRLKYIFFEDSKKNVGHKAAKKIKIPTLIVHGDKDESVPIEQSKKTASLIRNCKLEIIKGADHRYTNSKDFEKMIDLVTKFIVENS